MLATPVEEDMQMSDPSSNPNSELHTGDNTGQPSDRSWTTDTPRWVKVSGIIALVVVLLFLILLLAGGSHGPSRHALSIGGPGQHTQSSVIAVGLQQP